MELITIIHEKLRGVKWQQRSGDFHADCPFCGKQAKKGQTHFSYSEKGYKCFVCGEKGGLLKLAHHLQAEIKGDIQFKPRPPKTPKKAAVFPYKLLRGYTAHPDKYRLWQAYKPLTNATIDTWQLGVGYLPVDYRDLRLIVPLIRNDKLVMLRGRAVDNVKPGRKWITNSKYQGGYTPPLLFGTKDIPLYSHILILANMIDALLWRQVPGTLFGIPGQVYTVAPTTGEESWQAGWGKHLADLQPRQIMVCFDNDSTGRAGAQKVMADLRTAGLAMISCLWEWPQGTPEKFDMGDLYVATRTPPG